MIMRMAVSAIKYFVAVSFLTYKIIKGCMNDDERK